MTPAQISKIMDTMHEGQFGTLLPKTIFNITEKGRTLLGMADGILEHTTDAEKTMMYFAHNEMITLTVLFLFLLT